VVQNGSNPNKQSTANEKNKYVLVGKYKTNIHLYKNEYLRATNVGKYRKKKEFSHARQNVKFAFCK